MIDNLILYFGINGLESLILLCYMLNFSFKNVGKFNLVLTWLLFNSFNYSVSKFIGIPPVNQIIIILLGGVMLSIMLELNMRKCILKTLVWALIAVVIETLYMMAMIKLFNISYFDLNVFKQCIILLPTKLIWIITLYGISGGVVDMKIWWNDIKRKQPTKK